MFGTFDMEFGQQSGNLLRRRNGATHRDEDLVCSPIRARISRNCLLGNLTTGGCGIM
jgi:hypothetical protein